MSSRVKISLPKKLRMVKPRVQDKNLNDLNLTEVKGFVDKSSNIA
jgi:hypothetical protein